MSAHDSCPSSPSSTPHDGTALLPPPPTPPRGSTPPLTPDPAATTEGCAMSLPPSPGGELDLAPPRAPCRLLPPPPDGHDGGAATTGEHFLDHFLPPGYRFHPQDEELVTHYLGNKIGGRPLPPNKIYDVRLYDHNPETLAAMYPQWGENKWFFFTPRQRKYPNGHRPNRAAGDGYWKATGSDKPVIGNVGATVGSKKALVFYRGKPPDGDKTNWIMNEYRIEDANQRRHDGTMKLDDWVLCSIHGSTEGRSERRTKRRRVEAKPRPTSSTGKRRDKKQAQVSKHKQHNSHIIDQAAAAALPPAAKPDISSDEVPHDNILQTNLEFWNNYSSSTHDHHHEDNRRARDHLLQLAPYLHGATLQPYQYFHPNGHHCDPFTKVVGSDLVLHYGSYEKQNSVGGLYTDALAWSSTATAVDGHQVYWNNMPETLDHGLLYNNAWGLCRSSCLEPAPPGNLQHISCADADADAALANLSHCSWTDPFGINGAAATVVVDPAAATSQTYAGGIGDLFFEFDDAPHDHGAPADVMDGAGSSILFSEKNIMSSTTPFASAPAAGLIKNDGMIYNMISSTTFRNSPRVPGSCAGVSNAAGRVKCGGTDININIPDH